MILKYKNSKYNKYLKYYKAGVPFLCKNDCDLVNFDISNYEYIDYKFNENFNEKFNEKKYLYNVYNGCILQYNGYLYNNFYLNNIFYKNIFQIINNKIKLNNKLILTNDKNNERKILQKLIGFIIKNMIIFIYDLIEKKIRKSK